MNSLPALLVSNGYAQSAANAVATTLLGDSPAIARERITAIAHNYYMQYLAIQLSRFGFDLNRPRIKPEQLRQAEAFIDGKLGNEPLDNRRLAVLLDSLVDDVLARNSTRPMQWADFYHYEYNAGEGVMIRGADMMKALIKSNTTHYGTHADIYHHSFNDVEYKTLSMHHLIARILTSCKEPVVGVNTFGIQVKPEEVKRLRALINRIGTMRDPQLRGFFQQNAHHMIRQKLALIFKELLSDSTDLYQLYHLQIQLVRSNFKPAMYNPEWQSLLREMQEGLQWIATPYARPRQAATIAA